MSAPHAPGIGRRPPLGNRIARVVGQHDRHVAPGTAKLASAQSGAGTIFQAMAHSNQTSVASLGELGLSGAT